MADEVEVHYRRAPPSQIQRDRRRARSYCDQQYTSHERQSINVACINDVGPPLFVQPFENTPMEKKIVPSVPPNTKADNAHSRLL